MLTISRYCGLTPVIGDVGLEIEAEFRTNGPGNGSIPVGWRMKTDGSLRNCGREFITNGPISLDVVEERVRKITDLINSPGYQLIPDNPRASVHVHVNVLDFTLLQFYTAATAYWLMENLLLKHCSEDLREGNFYCRRLVDVEPHLKKIIMDVKHGSPFFSSGHFGGNRYVSQNLSSVTGKGTIEYRGMRGTTDPEVITTWAKALFKLTRASKDFRTPDHLFEAYEAMTPEGRLRAFFPQQDQFIEQLMGIPDWEPLLEENLDLIDSLAFVHSWEKWYERVCRNNGVNFPSATELIPGDVGTITITGTPFGYTPIFTNQNIPVSEQPFFEPMDEPEFDVDESDDD